MGLLTKNYSRASLFIKPSEFVRELNQYSVLMFSLNAYRFLHH